MNYILVAPIRNWLGQSSVIISGISFVCHLPDTGGKSHRKLFVECLLVAIFRKLSGIVIDNYQSDIFIGRAIGNYGEILSDCRLLEIRVIPPLVATYCPPPSFRNVAATRYSTDLLDLLKSFRYSTNGSSAELL